MRRIGDVLGDLTPPEGEGAKSRGPKPASGTGHEPEVCPICKGKGFLIHDVPPGHPDFNRLVPCRCTEARLAGERMAGLRNVSDLAALERMTFDTFLPGGAGLPEATHRELRSAYDMCLQYAQAPHGWLVLYGGYGAGKTHLAAAIANYNLDLGLPALFVVVPDLLDHLRAAFGPSSEIGLDERLDAIREASLLILDDLGAHNSTAWAQEKLYQILNYRYNHRLPTVITTNQRLDELDPRIASRLADVDLSQVIGISAPDFRAGGSSLGAFDRSGRNLSSLSLHTEQTFESFSLRRNEDMESERKASLELALNEARAFAQRPSGWLVLSGTYGCGKTHLAAAIANYQVATGQQAPLFIVVPDLLDHLRATFSPNSPTTLDRVFEQVKTAPLLVLDDLGTESATPWAREKLFQLLNYRYSARLPTVITTSAKINEIEPRLQSRMLDKARCTFFLITAEGYRGSGWQQSAYNGERREPPAYDERGEQAAARATRKPQRRSKVVE